MNAEHFFDDLARTLAEPMPRHRAVRVVGASLAALAVPGVSSGVARAATTRFGLCPQGSGRRQCWTSPDWLPGRPDPQPYCCKFPPQQWSCGDEDNGYACRNQCPGVNPVLRKRQVPTWSSATYPDGSPRRYNCCPLPDFEPHEGECLGTCTFTHGPGTYRCGADCCPDSQSCCDRVFTFKDPYCCSYEEALKGAGEDTEQAGGLAALALIGVGLVVATGGLGAIVVAGLAIGVGLGALAGKVIADDPPDPKYKKLFRPRVPQVAPVPREGLSPAAARALDRLIANRLRAGAYAIAYIRSIEKAQGAEKARDNAWARRHRKAAAGYAREAARTLERDRSLSTVALRELQREGFVDTGVSLAQVRQAQQRIRQRGLPVEMTRALRFAGVDDARIAAYRTAVSQLNPKLAVGVGAFGAVTDRRLADANAAMVKALRRAARA